MKHITVAQHERALVWKNKTFAGVLEPGKHWLIAPMSDVQAQLCDLTVPEFEHARVDFLVKEARTTMEQHGIKLASVGIKGVILPGEMRDILNRVVEAEKVAQANLIKRREETAATRSLLNTARLMDENPTLLRLKELETLEKVTEKVDKLTVFGGLDGVLRDVVRIQVPAN
jgi:regulator of protease activity HflC (stomatin/prohibitin superfamily)